MLEGNLRNLDLSAAGHDFSYAVPLKHSKGLICSWKNWRQGVGNARAKPPFFSLGGTFAFEWLPAGEVSDQRPFLHKYE